jgi:2-methylcitrate dehydratase PrpD
MVKRLHIGRAGESGVLAASLAARGFTAPVSALEGTFGFIRVFCRDYDMDALVRGLGETYVSRTILTKRYACHITAHTPVDSAIAIREAHGFKPQDIESMTIAGTERMLRANNIPRPKDLMMSQYSIPYCTALAMFANPMDPDSFNEAAAADPKILDLSARTTMVLASPPDDQGDMTTTLTVKLKDGRSFAKRATHFKGTPEDPLTLDELRGKFMLVTKKFGNAKMSEVFDRIQRLESETSLDWLGA